MLLLSKNINFNENETEARKWKIPHPLLQRLILCFSSFKNHKLKLKLWWVGARERKKRALFVPFILCRRNFFKNLFFISMYSVLNMLSEYSYFYISENITSYKFLLVFKIVESFQCIVNRWIGRYISYYKL